MIALSSLLLLACFSTGEPEIAPTGTPLSGADGFMVNNDGFVMRLLWTRTAVPPPRIFTLTTEIQEAFLAIEERSEVAFLPAVSEYTASVAAVEASFKAGRAPSAADAEALVKSAAAVRTIALDSTASAADALGAEGRAAIAGAQGSLGLMLGRGPLESLTVGIASARMPDLITLGIPSSTATTALQLKDEERLVLLDTPLLRYRGAMGGIGSTAEDAPAAIRAAGEAFLSVLAQDHATRLELAAQLMALVPADQRITVATSKPFRLWAGTLAGRDAFSFAFTGQMSGEGGGAGGGAGGAGGAMGGPPPEGTTMPGAGGPMGPPEGMMPPGGITQPGNTQPGPPTGPAPVGVPSTPPSGG